MKDVAAVTQGTPDWARKGTTLLSTLLLVGLMGCQDGNTAQDRFVLSDSAGVRIASSSAPRLTEAVIVAREPVLTIPADFGAPVRLLYNVRHAEVLSDGRLVVGNAGTNELFFFSEEGRYLGAVGGAGDGPGEFQRLFGLHACEGDRLVVEELTRLSIISGRTASFDGNVQVAGHLSDTRVPIGGIREDCGAALFAAPEFATSSGTSRSFDSLVNLFWADFSTGARDSIGSFEGTELYSWQLDGRSVPVRAPFGSNAVWAVHPLGVVYGSARDAGFRLLGDGGALRGVVRWSEASREVSDEDWTYFEESREDFSRLYPDEARLQPPSDFFERPRLKPAYSAMRVDGSGRIWLNRYGRYSVYGPESSSSWAVFTPEGEWLADVSMPGDLEVLAITDSLVVGVAYDAMDLGHVQVHRYDPLPAEPSG